MDHTYHPSTNTRIEIQASLGIKRDPISKITKVRETGDVVQMVEHMPSKFETLHSTPSTTKKIQNKNNGKPETKGAPYHRVLGFLSIQ
jgi:hypothetical protein